MRVWSRMARSLAPTLASRNSANSYGGCRGSSACSSSCTRVRVPGHAHWSTGSPGRPGPRGISLSRQCPEQGRRLRPGQPQCSPLGTGALALLAHQKALVTGATPRRLMWVFLISNLSPPVAHSGFSLEGGAGLYRYHIFLILIRTFFLQILSRKKKVRYIFADVLYSNGRTWANSIFEVNQFHISHNS